MEFAIPGEAHFVLKIDTSYIKHKNFQRDYIAHENMLLCIEDL